MNKRFLLLIAVCAAIILWGNSHLAPGAWSGLAQLLISAIVPTLKALGVALGLLLIVSAAAAAHWFSNHGGG
jgi:hypothetical protein